MPVTSTSPGVYIEEIPSGVQTIVGVATSIGAFVDCLPQGPMNKAVRIPSLADFGRQFRGLDIRSEANYGLQQFFLNGGSEAYVVRTTSTTPANAATAVAMSLADGGGVRLDVDYGVLRVNATSFELESARNGDSVQ